MVTWTSNSLTLFPTSCSCIGLLWQHFTVNRYNAVHTMPRPRDPKGKGFYCNDISSATQFVCREFVTFVDKCEVLSLFTCYESYFCLSGFVNKHNFHCWIRGNPFKLRYTPLCTVTITVPWATSCFENSDPCHSGTLKRARHPWVQSDMFKYPLSSV